jgi:hypothetical protein
MMQEEVTKKEVQSLSEFIQECEAFFKKPEIKAVSSKGLSLIELPSNRIGELLGSDPETSTIEEFCTNLPTSFSGLNLAKNEEIYENEVIEHLMSKDENGASMLIKVHKLTLDLISKTDKLKVKEGAFDPSEEIEVSKYKSKVHGFIKKLEKIRILLSLKKITDPETRLKIAKNYVDRFRNDDESEEVGGVWKNIIQRKASKEFIDNVLSYPELGNFVEKSTIEKLTKIKSNIATTENSRLSTTAELNSRIIDEFTPLVHKYFPEYILQLDKTQSSSPEEIITLVQTILKNISTDFPSSSTWKVVKYPDEKKKSFMVMGESNTIKTPGCERKNSELVGILVHEVIGHALRWIQQQATYDGKIIGPGQVGEGANTVVEQFYNKGETLKASVSFGKYNHRILMMALARHGIPVIECIKLFKISYSENLQTEDKGFTDLLQRVLRGAAFENEVGFLNEKDLIYMEGTMQLENWSLIMNKVEKLEDKTLFTAMEKLVKQFFKANFNLWDIRTIKLAVKERLIELDSNEINALALMIQRPSKYLYQAK